MTRSSIATHAMLLFFLSGLYYGYTALGKRERRRKRESAGSSGFILMFLASFAYPEF
jgi:hypothetical protein